MYKLLFLILLIVVFKPVSAQDSTYIWPTNAGQFLSSTFGETRSTHFHAGIDIKTWGREGYEVYATKAGILSSLLITNKGYGKAIYLKHDDGTYTVYAHLQRFNEQFQSLADSIRLQDYSYTMNGFFEHDSIRISQGDIIGYTGSTGIGPPHLHYEIRDINNEPINPLRSNLLIEDDISPTIKSIMVEPRNIDSRVSGSAYPIVVNPSFVRNDTTFFDTVFVSGNVGLAVNVFDQANSVNNKYAAYELALKKKETILFYERLDQFDFEQAQLMFLDRIPAPESTTRSFQRLYTANGINHPFACKRMHTPQLLDGTYHIIAKDYYGNTSISAIPVIQKLDVVNTSSLINYRYWTNDWISINDSTNINLRNFDDGILWNEKYNQRILSLKHNSNETLSRLAGSESSTIITPDYRLRTQFPRNSFYDSLSVIQSYTALKDTILITIGNSQLIVKKDFLIQFYLGNNSSNTNQPNLYNIGEDGDFNYVDSWVTGRTLNALPENLGEFIVLSDTIPPSISNLRLINPYEIMRTYSLQTSDNLSGIDFKSAFFSVNGKRGIAEYDYENDTFIFYLPGFKPDEADSVYFEVKDKAGNMAFMHFSPEN